MYTWIFQCCKICWGQTFYTGDIWNLLSAMCFFFSVKPIGLGRENTHGADWVENIFEVIIWPTLGWRFGDDFCYDWGIRRWNCRSPSRGPTACTTQERAWPGPGICGGSVLIGKARSVAVDNVLPWHLFACSTNKGLDDGCKPAQILKINSSLCSHHHQEFWQVAKCHFTANAEPSKRGQLHVLVAKSQLPG